MLPNWYIFYLWNQEVINLYLSLNIQQAAKTTQHSWIKQNLSDYQDFTVLSRYVPTKLLVSFYLFYLV